MTVTWKSAVTLVAALVLGSCATPSVGPQVEAPAGPVAESPKPAFKKKPRLNGRGEISSISLEEFFALHQSGKLLLFDARPGFIYQISHVPGAINLTKHNCDQKIHDREAMIKSALAGGKTIVVYCTGIMCPDARAVAMHLSGFGYPSSIFSGGWDAWTDAGMPVE